MNEKNQITQSGDGFMLTLRVLGRKVERGTWAAHCLETDLVGYGRSFEKALDNLMELTVMQISFAKYKNQPALLDRPAPTEIIETYNSLLRIALQHFTTQKMKMDDKRRVGTIQLPNKPSNIHFSVAQA